ncbi:coxsackievirus and adenovirus receptor homolog [Xyrichtys novacula]|uniref:Coxsackievirus and adenovirus receptor homolog n=1 Tax=Xyrichtys novacula TaxID=13765 RepID=A0AAV1GDZ1_XYRNO|nr:coxsackievirus and adenovirus receptor homolog [Xyrichtys novacula]
MMSKERRSSVKMVSFLSCLHWLSVYLFCTASLLSTELKTAHGMQVTSTGPQTIQKAEGESVTLGCRYTLSASDTGELDIEWSVVSPDPTQKDQMLISYTSGTKYIHGDNDVVKGLGFAANDPSFGEASLSISPLSPAHSATYQCKVRKSPGVDTRKVSLMVLAKPSVPKCWVEGGELVGEAVSLHCKSAKGSTPLKYTWRREIGGPIPAAATQNSVTGELKISNHSLSLAGIYLCEANNAVGAEHCRINLKASKPPNRAAVIVGTVVGSILLTFILLVFIVLVVWKLSSRHRREKEFSNEIREDVPPPESRPVSRHTSRSTSQHPQVSYCQVGESEVNSVSEGRTHAPSSNSHGHTPVKFTPVQYDSQYGYAV